ncbi:hypothetical protein LZ198_42235 [Myxococcus sp. K15C18031901]|uniref:hypothetical protein n=1 Tax=Myxococcus dinghuensis TaxID=2906761 RepID=UPI0020A74ED7|nr:hypothetical protein [Myxococcus dinghuensis]MCP3105497.1 hypothetical protein [Myxococcus dinghuensis]
MSDLEEGQAAGELERLMLGARSVAGRPWLLMRADGLLREWQANAVDVPHGVELARRVCRGTRPRLYGIGVMDRRRVTEAVRSGFSQADREMEQSGRRSVPPEDRWKERGWQ